MRTAMMFAAAAALAACNWTEFDDLEHDAWVVSTQKPDVKSSDYGVAIQRGASSTTGGTLVVIGAGQPTYSELLYDASGAAQLAPGNTLLLNAQYGIGTLDAQPILLADPTGDDIALVVNSGANSISVLTGAGQINLHQLFVTPSSVDAATYVKPPNRTDAGHAGEAQPAEPLIASGEFVVSTFYASPPNPTPTCKLTDGGVAIMPRALGAVVGGPVEDVLAWGASGKLYRYPASVFLGCATQEPTASVDAMFSPGHGAQILSVPGLAGPLVVLQGHHDADDTSVLQVYNASTLAKVGGPVSLPRLRTAAMLNAGGTPYVIAGYPANVVDGKAAGQVLLFKVSATGLDSAPAATFNDAQPETNQSFGRAVAAMPFNGKQVIAVAADNEIFVYFRANLTSGTTLYDETRQGR
jgi:hypothetical protein